MFDDGCPKLSCWFLGRRFPAVAFAEHSLPGLNMPNTTVTLGLPPYPSLSSHIPHLQGMAGTFRVPGASITEEYHSTATAFRVVQGGGVKMQLAPNKP